MRAILRVLLVAPTGSGKTVIAAWIIFNTIANGFRVLFVAHRRELIKQCFAKLVRNGIPPERIGIIMADIPSGSLEMWPNDPCTLSDDDMWRRYARRRPGASVQVASISTLRNRAHPDADLVVVDEAHHGTAATYLALQAKYPKAAHLGLTATPYGPKGRGLGPAYDELVLVATPPELIGDGFLVDPSAWTVPASELPDLSRVKIKNGDYDADALSLACDQMGLVGNIVEHWKRRAEGRRTFLFASSVDHSKHCAARFVEAGVTAEHIDGETPNELSEAILARLARGETLVVCNYGVFCEGTDIPSVKCAILARPTKSVVLAIQQPGRILRPWEGVGAIILDHAGVILEHGLPQDVREFTLDDQPRRKKEGSGPSCKQCMNCYALVSSQTRVCPSCGEEFVFDAAEKNLEEADGELVEVRPATVAEKRQRWDDICREWSEENARREATPDGPAVRKGGWVWHRYVEKFNEKPPAGCRVPGTTTEDTRSAALAKLIAVAKAKGIPESWAHRKVAQQFATEAQAAE